MAHRKLLSTNAFLFLLVLVFTLLVYLWGLFVPIMEPDAAVYAVVSMEMHDSGRYQDIIFKGMDWLDKPHFQFWITGLFFRVFGVSTVTYKLPSVLLFLAGVYYTYLFGKQFYSRRVGVLAGIFLATAWHIILSNNDVRAEPILTCFTIMSLYHFARYLSGKKAVHLMAGAAGLACLLMTKGLFTIVPVASGVLLTLVVQRRWKEIFHLQWLAALLLTVVFTLPTLLSYYYQFDLHPEKLVFGKHGVSGIRFFLWDSQWGRFTNSGPIKGKGDPSFFFHTLLWVFAPWSLLAFAALFTRTRKLFRGATAQGEWYTYFGFLVMFLIFTFSRFQLAHYLNPILPFIALITAGFVVQVLRRGRYIRVFTIIQASVSALLVAGIVFLVVFYGLRLSVDTVFVFVFAVGISGYILLRSRSHLQRIVFPAAFSILLVNYVMNRNFYPDLMHYQSESEVAFYCKDQGINTESMISYDVNAKITDFYLRHTIPYVQADTAKLSDLSGRLVYTTAKGLDTLRKTGLSYQVIHRFPDFRVTKLTLPFLNPRTRPQVSDSAYLLQMDTIRSVP